MTFSRRVGRLPTYPMAELPAIKRRLIEQGVDVIDVGAGDADFPPPDVAVQAVTRALQDPAMSRYAFQLGLPAFREAAAARCAIPSFEPSSGCSSLNGSTLTPKRRCM